MRRPQQQHHHHQRKRLVRVLRLLPCLLLLLLQRQVTVEAFENHRHLHNNLHHLHNRILIPTSSTASNTLLFSSSSSDGGGGGGGGMSSSSPSYYGRGSDIWPPTNADSTIRLADSFPNGILPDIARRELQQIGAKLPDEQAPLIDYDEPTTTATKRRRRRRPYPVARTFSQPPIAAATNTSRITSSDDDDETEREQQPSRTTGRKRRALSRILRRAARRQEDGSEAAAVIETTTPYSTSFLDKTPAIVALVLLFSGTIQPLDCLLVASLSMYTWLLSVVANSIRSNTSNGQGMAAPVLPALPPTGHVPFLVRHPLGFQLLHSRLYDAWLSLGVVLGLAAPFALWLYQTTVVLGSSSSTAAANNNLIAAQWTSRPLFLLCSQALTEAACRRAITPLPIRIFIPVAYNTLRLGYLGWAVATATAITTSTASSSSTAVVLLLLTRILAIANLCYWTLNLFGFLVPVALMRYMRAHFFAVEAASVTIRPGMQDTVR